MGREQLECPRTCGRRGSDPSYIDLGRRVRALQSSTKSRPAEAPHRPSAPAVNPLNGCSWELLLASINMYWVYDLPNWLFAALTIAVAVAIGLAGFYATRKWVRRVHGNEHSHNDIVGYYLGTICLLYGITLGLVVVGTWQTYTDVDTKVDQEASAVAAMYREMSRFPDPKRAELQADLREYTRQLIDIGWPLQRRGIAPQNTASAVNATSNTPR